MKIKNKITISITVIMLLISVIPIITASPPPPAPLLPEGPTEGEIGVKYKYESISPGDFEEEIWYRFIWDTMGEITDWMGPYKSGEKVKKSHIWYTSGEHSIIVQATFRIGSNDISESPQLIVTIADPNDIPPTPNTPSGDTPILVNETHGYGAIIYGNRDIYYQFSMGNGYETRWLGPRTHGTAVGYMYSWNETGEYDVVIRTSYYDNGLFYSESPRFTVEVMEELDTPPAPDKPEGETIINISDSHIYVTTIHNISKDVYFQFCWGDDSHSKWIGPFSAETIVGYMHLWNEIGTYAVTVRSSYYESGVSCNESLELLVQVNSGHINNPPEKPGKPSGSSTGQTGESILFSTSTIDPDNDKVMYGMDWDNDDVVDEWTEFYESGVLCSVSHSWDVEGVYNIKVKAKDEHKAESEWSNIKTITISDDVPPPPPPPPEDNLTIEEIKGGLGVQVIIRNNGNKAMDDVNWTITVTKGLLGLRNNEFDGEIETLNSNEEETVQSGIFFGLGKITIEATAKYGDEKVKETASGFIIGIFVIIS